MSGATPTMNLLSYIAGYGLRTVLCTLASRLPKRIEFHVLAITGYRLQFFSPQYHSSVLHFFTSYSWLVQMRPTGASLHGVTLPIITFNV
jgi:hypothetical protein